MKYGKTSPDGVNFISSLTGKFDLSETWQDIKISSVSRLLSVRHEALSSNYHVPGSPGLSHVLHSSHWGQYYNASLRYFLFSLEPWHGCWRSWWCWRLRRDLLDFIQTEFELNLLWKCIKSLKSKQDDDNDGIPDDLDPDDDNDGIPDIGNQ